MFNISIEKSLIASAMLLIILFVGDLFASIIFLNFKTANEIRESEVLKILSNLSVIVISFIIMKIKIIRTQIQKFYKTVELKEKLINILYFTFMIIVLSYLMYNLTKDFKWEYNSLINIIIIIVLIIITVIFIAERNDYIRLLSEYNSMFKYVQNFEVYIEKEQLNRHEYKNQLAVLKCLSNEESVKKKITEILDDNINIEDKSMIQLKSLPKGGIKGLMYYKVIVAQKNKIKLEINVSLDIKTKLLKLKGKEIKDLCNLIGIYFDNAIEAAKETRKKSVLIEIYEFDDKVKFVFSNTYNKRKLLDDRFKKGISSKGKGRGNGLYFASKIIEKNTWLEQRQDIIENYYVQELVIKEHKKSSRKNRSHKSNN